MAPHPSTPEWKHVIATAALAGVTFTRIYPSRKKGEYTLPDWIATLPMGGMIARSSKFEAAKSALRILEGLPPQARETEDMHAV